MTTSTIDSDSSDVNNVSLSVQQESLRRLGKLGWMHWWIIGLSAILTFLGWHVSNSLQHRSEVDRFNIEAQRVVEQMTVRMAHYEDALIAGVATMLSHQHDMSRAQWKNYANTLDLTNRYPGVNGIGLIREVATNDISTFELAEQPSWPGFKLFPQHDFPVHFPIVFIEPADENAAAVGLDVAFELNRRTAALRARDLNTTQISGPIELVQDDGKTPGFLFYAPYYRNSTGFDGFVYAPLVVKNLVQGVLGADKNQIIFSIRDGDSTLYDESEYRSDIIVNATHVREIEKEFYGRQWTFLIHSAAGFSRNSGLTQPTIVLICGLAVELMLLALFLLLTRSNDRILTLAESMTDRLGQQTKDLADKNSELESFAHVVSHDLKTPIRAIQSLTLFIEEDMQELSAPANIQEVLARHITRINDQAERGHALIQGLLNYSLIGHETDTVEQVDTELLLQNIGNSLGLSNAQFYIVSPMPVFNTYSVRLTQVLENLIGNAYKYHPSPSTANIIVRVKLHNQYYRFSVADDGNGIDKRYHERIFKPFTTLQPHLTTDSSGIGLSIVKKTVEGMGGTVGIVPDTSSGTEFYFDWPLTHNDTNEDMRHAA